MLVFDVISLVLLSLLLFWTVYTGSIVYVGIRGKRKGSIDNEIKEYPTFSIIVPTKNEEAVITRCLDSLLALDYPKEKMQILIVDGNSTDGTTALCSRFLEKYPEVFQLISEQQSKGKPAALNLALPYLKGEIVGVFDADSLLKEELLKKVATYFGDKQVMAVQGRTTSVNEKQNILTRIIATEEKAWFQALLAGKEKLRLFVPFNGSCQFIRRNVLEELGGWDETSLTEDVELALRLVEKNYVIKYASDVCSGQETPQSLGGLVKQRVRWYRGNMETAIKYGRLLKVLNRRTIDAEISLGGPFMMVVSFLSYLNWAIVALLLLDKNPIIYLTGVVIALTAVSLLSVGVALTASEKSNRLRNVLWFPSIYLYWLFQMCIASWAFVKLILRQKRVWSKTVKQGFIASAS